MYLAKTVGRGPATCPLDGQCQTKELVYQATVTKTDTGHAETYTGLTGGTFKKRYNKQMSGKYVWKLRPENSPFKITWKLLAKGRVFNSVTKVCQLCLKEKYHIMFSPEGATLNKRTELYNSCRHRIRLLLDNFKT